MPASGARLYAAALLGYVSVALVFAWPLPVHLSSALLGPQSGDTGVYVWNLWVFRHEIVENGSSPFSTTAILAGAPPVALTLHNYTPLAGILAFPLQPLVGTLAAFNILLLAGSVLNAWIMFLFLRDQVRDSAAAWIGGLLFGFSPFITARQMAHFSLVQAAALPAFAWVLWRFESRGPTMGLSMTAGAVIAWAFLSDPYYAVYCALMAAFFLAWHAVTVRATRTISPRPVRVALDLAIAGVAVLIGTVVVSGGGSFDLFGLRVSVRHLYTPTLALTVLVAARAWLAFRPHVAVRLQGLGPAARAGTIAALTCGVLLMPVVTGMVRHLGEEQWIAPSVWWRSSAPGVDLLAFLVPNPVGTLSAWTAPAWLTPTPDGFHENVASIPWVALIAVAAAVVSVGTRLPRYWVAFTGLAALTALGPFVRVAGASTYLPAPWAALRYLPVVGAARMPTRLTILVMLGAAVLLACAVRGLRERAGRPWVVAVLAGLLVVELLPAPRPVFPVRVPRFYPLIAADPRPVRVLPLPTGLRDGVSSAGNFSADAQFLQVFHRKPLIGGYLSRLPGDAIDRYRAMPLLDVLLDLSEGAAVDARRRAKAIEEGPENARDLNLGYVIVHDDRVTDELVSFARQALLLDFVDADGGQQLYSVR